MELRWTEEAAADLEHITDYLFQNAPERAAELVRGIYNAPAALLTFPYRGRAAPASLVAVAPAKAGVHWFCAEFPLTRE